MKIGILGGGQLAMMMVQMSAKHNIEFIVVDPSTNPPASKFAKCISSSFDDKISLDMLIESCDVVTIDFENVPSESLKYLEKNIRNGMVKLIIKIQRKRKELKKWLK